MALSSPKNEDVVNHPLSSDPVFKEKMENVASLADKIGHDALIEIRLAQIALQRLSEGVIPPEMGGVVRVKAEQTFSRYGRFLNALSTLTAREPRLSHSYGPGESPIHSLPPEMLSVVFSLTIESPSMIAGKRWMPSMLRLVSRHWRTVAEGTPSLWREIDSAGGLVWLKRSVQWSKSASLDVHLNHPGLRGKDDSFDDCAGIALAELTRIHTLEISTYYGYQELQKLAELLASRPAPLLTEFEFDSVDIFDVCALHAGTFAGEVPERLQTLVVCFSIVLPSCPIFRAPLTTLDIQNCVVWRTVDQLLLTLAGLPTLEYLTLKTETGHEIPPVDASVAVKDFKPQAVKLPNLKSLRVREDIEVVVAVFLHLDIPNAITVSLTVDYEDTGSLMDSDILSRMNGVFSSYLNRVFGVSAAPPDAFTSLSILYLKHIHGFTLIFTEPAVKRRGLSEFSLGITYGTRDDYQALFMRTLSWPPMNSGITRLLVPTQLGLLHYDETWTHLIGCLRNLEEVHVGQSATQFIRVVSTRGAEATRSLRKLVFYKEALQDASIDALAALLSIRHGLGYPSMALSFIACATAGEALDKLEGTPGVAGIYVHVDPRRRMSEAANVTDDWWQSSLR